MTTHSRTSHVLHTVPILIGIVYCGQASARGHGPFAPGRDCDGDPAPQPVACQGAAPASALISDFDGATSAPPFAFGAAPNVSGGTFAYAGPGLDLPQLSLTSGTNGTPALEVAIALESPPEPDGNYFGFGLYFDSCIDASAYQAIRFSLSGELGDCTIRFAATSSEHVSPNDDPRGVCALASCFPPSVPVSTSGTTLVPFADLVGGSPDIVDAASLIGVQWQMSAPPGATCMASFSIDDISFVRRSVPLTPDAKGRVAASASSLGVEGNWHVYGDDYAADGTPPGVCEAAGHAKSECSVATEPLTDGSGFPNVDGKLCTRGSTAVVLPLNGELDYAHMWGVGIGLSLNEPANGHAGTFDANAHGVVGVSFDIDNVPPGLRVQFPTPSDSAGIGPSYWGADEYYPSSPVQVGTNVVPLGDVQSPDPSAPPTDTTQLLQIGFLVTSNPDFRNDFDYCISNLKLIVQ